MSDLPMSALQNQPRSPHLGILVVRSDRLGDVVLSTPVFEVLKRHYSKSKLTVLVRETVKPLIQGLSSVDDVWTFDPQGRHSGFKGFFRLWSEMRRQRFQIMVLLQGTWKIAAAAFLARIPIRIGPYSKLYSFFFYNYGTRQRRSHVEMHEADYNLQLLRKLGIRVGTRNVGCRVSLSEEKKNWARDWLQTQGWKPNRPLILIHPGMGGSALNWPESHFIELIRQLEKEPVSVVVSGGPTEKPVLDRIESALGSNSKEVFFFRGKEGSSIEEFTGLCSHSRVVVAPSTGPLHIAVALGKSVVTFYSPIRVQSAIRWGPYLSQDEKASILVPDVYCGQDFKCVGSTCHYYSCMKGIQVSQALAEVKLQLRMYERN